MFYRDVLCMEVKNELDGAAFLAFGSYHHHIALNTWQSKDGKPPTAEMTGLRHVAIRPSRALLVTTAGEAKLRDLGLDAALLS